MAKLYKTKEREKDETASVGELIEWLKQFPSDLPVAYTWEGLITPVIFDRTELLTEPPKFETGIVRPVLLLDAETP